jgi:hypothetical protein
VAIALANALTMKTEFNVEELVAISAGYSIPHV